MDQAAAYDVSIVIPAYNEEQRLGRFLADTIRLTDDSDLRFEIIVVDDGSHDSTVEVANNLARGRGNVHVLELAKNRGKGYAVRRGLLAARGEIRCFLDADGATGAKEILRLLPLMEQYDMVFGSRIKQEKGQELVRRWYRHFIGLVFNLVLKSVLRLPFLDTQCGFKMIRANVVDRLVSRLYINGFGFDMELVYLAHRAGFKCHEVPVSWVHQGGSKVNLVTDSLRMFCNIFQTRWWHWTPIEERPRFMAITEHQAMARMEATHWWFVSRRRFLQRVIHQLDVDQPRILDLGCGTGGNLAMLASLGDVHGVDASEFAVDLCHKAGHHQVVQGHSHQLPFPPESFDLVTAFDVLEHIEDPIGALEHLSRVLRPGGKILLTVPAFPCLYGPHDIGHMIADSGLVQETSHFFFGATFLLAAPIRLLRRLMPGTTYCSALEEKTPPRWINRMLVGLCLAEFKVAKYIHPPFGTSLYAIATKPASVEQFVIPATPPRTKPADKSLASK
jgi:dolichyl-phosphate beta-glucosyltransferase